MSRHGASTSSPWLRVSVPGRLCGHPGGGLRGDYVRDRDFRPLALRITLVNVNGPQPSRTFFVGVARRPVMEDP